MNFLNRVFGGESAQHYVPYDRARPKPSRQQMIEHVARALCREQGTNPDAKIARSADDEGKYSPPVWVAYANTAIVAIETYERYMK